MLIVREHKTRNPSKWNLRNLIGQIKLDSPFHCILTSYHLLTPSFISLQTRGLGKSLNIPIGLYSPPPPSVLKLGSRALEIFF